MKIYEERILRKIEGMNNEELNSDIVCKVIKEADSCSLSLSSIIISSLDWRMLNFIYNNLAISEDEMTLISITNEDNNRKSVIFKFREQDELDKNLDKIVDIFIDVAKNSYVEKKLSRFEFATATLEIQIDPELRDTFLYRVNAGRCNIVAKGYAINVYSYDPENSSCKVRYVITTDKCVSLLKKPMKRLGTFKEVKQHEDIIKVNSHDILNVTATIIPGEELFGYRKIYNY